MVHAPPMSSPGDPSRSFDPETSQTTDDAIEMIEIDVDRGCSIHGCSNDQTMASPISKANKSPEEMRVEFTDAREATGHSTQIPSRFPATSSSARESLHQRLRRMIVAVEDSKRIHRLVAVFSFLAVILTIVSLGPNIGQYYYTKLSYDDDISSSNQSITWQMFNMKTKFYQACQISKMINGSAGWPDCEEALKHPPPSLPFPYMADSMKSKVKWRMEANLCDCDLLQLAQPAQTLSISRRSLRSGVSESVRPARFGTLSTSLLFYVLVSTVAMYFLSRKTNFIQVVKLILRGSFKNAPSSIVGPRISEISRKQGEGWSASSTTAVSIPTVSSLRRRTKKNDQSETSLWPEKFTKRRLFARQEENIPYIEFLRNTKSFGECDETDPSDYEEEEDKSVEEMSANGNNTCANDLSDGKSEAPSDEAEVVRLFMKGLPGDESRLKYRNQIEFVSAFYEINYVHAKESCNFVALLDQSSIGTHIASNKAQGSWRPYEGPLTSESLREALSKNRFLNPEKSATDEVSCKSEQDAERIIVFITNLDARSIHALASTASRSSAKTLQCLFYMYLAGKTSIGITIPSHGFMTFTMEFNISYYVLRSKTKSRLDSRKEPEGRPLRRSWDLPDLINPLRSSLSQSVADILLEVQISVAVTGIDNWVWIAHGFVDTYFDSAETVEGYHRWTGSEKNGGGRPDPLTAGFYNAENPIWTPREYFFKVLEIRVYQIRKEYEFISDMLKQRIDRANDQSCVSCNTFGLHTDCKLVTWKMQMLRVLEQVIMQLSNTIAAWERFRLKEILYFVVNGDCAGCTAPVSDFLDRSVKAVEVNFSEMNGLLRKLRIYQNMLCNLWLLNGHIHLMSQPNEAVKPNKRSYNSEENRGIMALQSTGNIKSLPKRRGVSAVDMGWDIEKAAVKQY